MAKNKLAQWYKLNEKKLFRFRGVKLTSKDENRFVNNLYNFGYNKIDVNKSNYNKKTLTKAFQRRFRQNLINGIVDKECFLISKSLIK